MTNRGKKGEDENSFSDEIKRIFHYYLKAIIWWKDGKYQIQALKRIDRYDIFGMEQVL